MGSFSGVSGFSEFLHRLFRRNGGVRAGMAGWESFARDCVTAGWGRHIHILD
ncbi:MAG: hypothetical protein OXU61_04755 [Gammaproteobacteria bacterium]|nr:hypothetical protein [Gammaproteobacteria bacterium]